jgi:low temperature requirement protein LtrA
LRPSGADVHVTNIELFFDLVYVFAVTQLSQVLVRHTTADGAWRTAILLALVWQAWVYTTWVTNWIDPDRLPTRVMLVAVMLGSLALAAQIPRAFTDQGMVIAVGYAAMQVGRSVFAVLALRGHRLQRNFERILVWSAVSGIAMIGGALVHGHARELVWAAAVAFDYLGGRVGFWTPRLGRSTTEEWTIEGSHFAERCEAFVIIALGESIVSIGSTLGSLTHVSTAQTVTFVAAFGATVGLWWIYFDRVAEHGSRRIASSRDPGRLGATAYHLVHPIIVGGIIAAAAADDVILRSPNERGHLPTTLLVLGGVAMFLGGHAIFKAIVFRVVPWSRILGVAVLALLLFLAPYVSALVLALLTLVVIVAVAVTDRVQHPPI